MSNRSSANASVPVTFGTPSRRAIRAPTAPPAPGISATVGGPACRGGRHRLDDLRVPGAPAQDAAQPVEHRGPGRVRHPREEVVRRHEHPGRARAALGAAAGEERGLERRERPVGRREPFDRRDPPPLDLADGHEARAHLLAVEAHRARPAVARVAADLRAGQPQVLAQDVDQAPAPVGGELPGEPVDREPDRRAGHATISVTARRTSVQRGVHPVRRRGPHVIDGGEADEVLRPHRSGQIVAATCLPRERRLERRAAGPARASRRRPRPARRARCRPRRRPPPRPTRSRSRGRRAIPACETTTGADGGASGTRTAVTSSSGARAVAR